MKIEKLLCSLISILLISACGSTPPKTDTASYFPPHQCEDTEILSALPADLTGAAYIPTTWQPAEGTDLKAIIDGGGIACTYGVQQAEVGATVSWVEDKDGLFASRTENWKRQGFIEANLPGISADQIFVISESAMNAREIHSWSANLLVHGNWIQVSASYIYKNSEASSLIKAAIASLRS